LDPLWCAAAGKKFDLILQSFGPSQKITMVVGVRSVTGLGLRESKDLVEAAPTPVKRSVLWEEAEAIKERFEVADWWPEQAGYQKLTDGPKACTLSIVPSQPSTEQV